jgi:DNA-binding MarR family transcriptional regulator
VSGDRRANALFLTKTGETELAALHEIRVGHEARAAAKIGDERAQRVFLEQLQRLTALKAAG